MTPGPLPESQPLLLASEFGRGRIASFLSLFWGPLGLPLLCGGVLAAMLQSSLPAVELFPLFLAVQLAIYLGAGLWWCLGAALFTTFVGFFGFFFSSVPATRGLYAGHIALAWAVFYLLGVFDRQRQKSWNRYHEEWDGLELEVSNHQSDLEETRAVIEDNRARIVAFDRLQLFTDDLIGPYHREELLGKAQSGLGAMFPRAKVSLHLYPKPDAPSPDDELGMKMLQWGQPRLLASRPATVPTWDRGPVIVLPVKGRENFLGWILLEAKNPDTPFEIHDLRLASIASDLIALALSNTERFTQTEALAISDELTGIYTRGYFNERLLEEFAKARHKGRPLTLVILDIDHFKKVNDVHGHHIGDEVLRWLARLVTGQARETDFVARYGGEEFVVLMPNTRGADALRFTQRLCKTIAATPFRWGAKRVRITLSAGVASLADEVTTEEELIRRSDEALYAAKNGGRNRVCPYGG